MNDATQPVGRILTVILRNDAPMTICGDGPTYRSVRVELTTEQMAQLARHYTHTVAGDDFYEDVSRCFLEPEVAP